jgi:hypothetical protein
MTRWRTTGDQTPNGLLPLFSVAWLFLSPIENAGKQRFGTVFFPWRLGTQHARKFVEGAEVREALRVSRRDRSHRVRSRWPVTHNIEGGGR